MVWVLFQKELLWAKIYKLDKIMLIHELQVTPLNGFLWRDQRHKENATTAHIISAGLDKYTVLLSLIPPQN